MDTPYSVWAIIGNHKLDGRQQPALVVKHMKLRVRVLYLREGYGVDAIDLPEEDTRPLMYKGEPYPLKLHLRALKRMVKGFGITKRAKALLEEIT